MNMMQRILIYFTIFYSSALPAGIISIGEISRPLVYPKRSWIFRGTSELVAHPESNDPIDASGLIGILIPDPTFSISDKLSWSITSFRLSFFQVQDNIKNITILTVPSLALDFGLTDMKYSIDNNSDSGFLEFDYFYVYYGLGLILKLPISNKFWVEPKAFFEAKNIDAILPSLKLLLGLQVSDKVSLKLFHSAKFLIPTGKVSYYSHGDNIRIYNYTSISGEIGLNNAFSIGWYVGCNVYKAEISSIPVGINLSFGWRKNN